MGERFFIKESFVLLLQNIQKYNIIAASSQQPAASSQQCSFFPRKIFFRFLPYRFTFFVTLEIRSGSIPSIRGREEWNRLLFPFAVVLNTHPISYSKEVSPQ
jgi:hypothetical protein